MPPKLKKVDSDKSQRSISAWLQKRAPITAIDPESQPPSSPRTRQQRHDDTTAHQPLSTGVPPRPMKKHAVNSAPAPRRPLSKKNTSNNSVPARRGRKQAPSAGAADEVKISKEHEEPVNSNIPQEPQHDADQIDYAPAKRQSKRQNTGTPESTVPTKLNIDEQHFTPPSAIRQSSNASYVTAHDSLSSPTRRRATTTPRRNPIASPERAKHLTEDGKPDMVMADQDDNMQNPLKRPHAQHRSPCPSIDSEKPRKRMRSRSPSSQLLMPTTEKGLDNVRPATSLSSGDSFLTVYSRTPSPPSPTSKLEMPSPHQRRIPALKRSGSLQNEAACEETTPTQLFSSRKVSFLDPDTNHEIPPSSRPFNSSQSRVVPSSQSDEDVEAVRASDQSSPIPYVDAPQSASVDTPTSLLQARREDDHGRLPAVSSSAPIVLSPHNPPNSSPTMLGSDTSETLVQGHGSDQSSVLSPTPIRSPPRSPSTTPRTLGRGVLSVPETTPHPSKTSSMSFGTLDELDDDKLNEDVNVVMSEDANNNNLDARDAGGLTDMFKPSQHNTPGDKTVDSVKHGLDTLDDKPLYLLDDSDDELADLGTIINPKRIKPAEPKSRQPSETRTTRQATGSLSLSSYRKKTVALDLTPKPQYNFSLGNLNKRHQRDLKAQEEIARAEAIVAEHQKRIQEDSELATQGDDQGKLLAAVVKDEDGNDQVGKVLQAMSRANLPQTQTAFHFIDVDEAEASMKVPDFPQLPGVSDALKSLEDEPFRKQAFALGFAKQIFRHNQMPQAVLDWLITASFCEIRADLAHGYLECLQQELANHPDGGKLDKQIAAIFANCTANRAITEITAIEHPLNSPKRCPPPQLVQFVKALGSLASAMSEDSKLNFLNILFCLGTDDELMRDFQLKHAHNIAFTAIFESIAPVTNTNSDIIHHWREQLQSPQLQSYAIASLPFHTPKTHHLRRSLALAFFLNTPPNSAFGASLNTDEALQTLPAMIVKHLETDPSLQITEETDYLTLCALLNLLDAAIDAGFSPVYPLSISSTSTSTAIPTSTLDAPTLRAARSAHNASIDAILRPLRRLDRGIVDSSALGSMRKTDAKTAVERLCWRLEYAVKVGGRKGRGLGGLDEEEGGQGGDGRGRESLDGWAVRSGRWGNGGREERSVVVEEGGRVVGEEVKEVDD